MKIEFVSSEQDVCELLSAQKRRQHACRLFLNYLEGAWRFYSQRVKPVCVGFAGWKKLKRVSSIVAHGSTLTFAGLF
jgi:hypothetical protein